MCWRIFWPDCLAPKHCRRYWCPSPNLVSSSVPQASCRGSPRALLRGVRRETWAQTQAKEGSGARKMKGAGKWYISAGDEQCWEGSCVAAKGEEQIRPVWGWDLTEAHGRDVCLVSAFMGAVDGQVMGNDAPHRQHALQMHDHQLGTRELLLMTHLCTLSPAPSELGPTGKGHCARLSVTCL